MPQIWLRNNTRMILFFFVLALFLTALGGLLALAISGSGWLPRLTRTAGWAMVILGTALAISQAIHLRRPRLAYADGELLVYLRAHPIRVPIEIVECFFLGQGPAMIRHPQGSEVENSTVVVRLAEAAEAWQQRDVHPRLGQWCNGYITIRGAWCEPLNLDVVNHLNRQLKEVKRARA